MSREPCTSGAVEGHGDLLHPLTRDLRRGVNLAELRASNMRKHKWNVYCLGRASRVLFNMGPQLALTAERSWAVLARQALEDHLLLARLLRRGPTSTDTTRARRAGQPTPHARYRFRAHA